MKQNRLRSKTAWLSVLTLVIFVAKTYFGYNIPEADQLINLILITGTAVGIFNNPERSDKY